MLRRCVFGGIFLALASSIALGQPGVVKTIDGASFQGEVTSDDTSVFIVNKGGVQTKLDKRNVASVEFTIAPHDQYTQQLSKLPAEDLKGRMALAHWAYDHQDYADARDALESVLKIDPNNKDATDFLDLVEKQVRLERNSAANRDSQTTDAKPPKGMPSPNAAAPTTGPTSMQATRAGGKNVLSAADINVIRQAEWVKSDANVRVRLKGDVKKRYVELRRLDNKVFNALSMVDQAWAIVHDGTPEMKKDVEVLSDPPSVLEFRRPAILGKVLAGCATAGCHGATGAGGLQLLAPADSDALVYTDFYILQQYTKTIGDRAYSMIDRNTSDNALLLQYGLPPETADLDHPAVPNMRAVFRTKTDPAYRAVVTWMTKTLPVVVPVYDVEYRMPTTQATTAPTSAPSK